MIGIITSLTTRSSFSFMMMFFACFPFFAVNT
ncbi:Uncharacterised protein [Segatella copri]|nr:Uncharacterised protein [Segatella copri]